MRLEVRERLRERLPKGSFARGAVLLGGSLVFSQLLLVLISPLLTRLYTPEDFGVLSVYSSCLSVLLVVGSLLYELAIPLPSSDGEAANLLALSLTVVTGSSLLSGGLLLLFGEALAAWTQTPGLLPLLWLLPLSLFGAGAYQAFNMWATRRKSFGAVAKTRMRQSVGAAVTQVGLGAALPGPTGLLAGDAVSRMVGSSTLARGALKESREALGQVSWAGMRAMAKRYRRFPLLSTWPTLMNAVLLQVPAFLLTSTYGAHVVGWYALAQRVLGMPLYIIGTAVSQAYMGEAARLAQEDRSLVTGLFWKTIKNLALIGLPLLLLIAWAAPWCFALVFGEEWRESGTYIRALAVLFFLQLLSIPVSNNLMIFERQDLHLLREVIRGAMMAAAVMIDLFLHLQPLTAVLLLSATGSVGYLVHLFLSWRAMRTALGDLEGRSVE